MGVLRDRMIEEMKLRNFSPATQQFYLYAVSRLAKYHHKSPDQLSMCKRRHERTYRCQNLIVCLWLRWLNLKTAKELGLTIPPSKPRRDHSISGRAAEDRQGTCCSHL